MQLTDPGRDAMNHRQLTTIVIVAILLLGGTAAIGTPSPADEGAGASDASDESADGVGPSDGLPDPVPDFVSSIHDAIDSFLHGTIDHLGEALSDLLGDEQRDDPDQRP